MRPPGLATVSELFQVASPPCSTTTSTPPSVASLIAVATSPFAWLTTASAPSSRARSSFASLDEVATTCAPSAFAIASDASATPPPMPHASTHSPGCRPAFVTSIRWAVSKVSGNAAASSKDIPSGIGGTTFHMRAVQLARLAEELGIDVVGATPAGPYAETERHIRERRARGLFADMRFTMAQPEVSCHPEKLLPEARTVVSAALCYYAEEPARSPRHGRLPRYTWSDAYVELREKLDELGRRLGGDYRVLVDENQHVDREGAARSGVGFYGKNTLLITRRFGSWVVLGTLVTDRELEATPPLGLDCGSCTLCIDACPTGALDEPGTLDATS